MKKLNNKGMSLVELIVSFAIVTVAVVYFSQSLVTVTKIYRNAEQETNELVNETYYLRLLDSYYKEALENSTFFEFFGVSSVTNLTLVNDYSTVTVIYDIPAPYFTVVSYYNPTEKLIQIKGTFEGNNYYYYTYFDYSKYSPYNWGGSVFVDL